MLTNYYSSDIILLDRVVENENDPELILLNSFEYDSIKQPNRMDQSEKSFKNRY